MKKILATLLCVGAVVLTACQNSESSSSAKGRLESKGYAVKVYSEAEAKAFIVNLNYTDTTFNDAIYAEKGKDEDKDLLLAFFFKNMETAETFINKNNNENLGLLNDYGTRNLGENLTKKCGIHNNVVYVGSETSFAAAF